MTNDTGFLNDAELATVSGGTLSLIGTSTIVVPHIPQARDLLTPDQIAKLLSLNGTFNPPAPRGL